MEATDLPDESGTWYVKQLVLLSFLEFPASFYASSKANVSHSYIVPKGIDILSRLKLPM
jgi:hypothetical protein